MKRNDGDTMRKRLKNTHVSKGNTASHHTKKGTEILFLSAMRDVVRSITCVKRNEKYCWRGSLYSRRTTLRLKLLVPQQEVVDNWG